MAFGEKMGVEAGPNQVQKMKEAPFADVLTAQSKALMALNEGVYPNLVYIDGKVSKLTNKIKVTNHTYTHYPTLTH